MSLDLAGHIAWGGAELGAAMSIHTSPNPRAVLSFDLFLPLTAECNLEFRISAAASLATDPNSPFGIAGSFSFGDTYFNTEVFGCLVSAIGTAVSEFWTELINGWLTGAGDFFTLLADAAAAVTALLYVNPNGQCIFFLFRDRALLNYKRRRRMRLERRSAGFWPWRDGMQRVLHVRQGWMWDLPLRR